MGLGVPENRGEALAWYRKATSLGDERSKQALGRLEPKK